MECTTATHGLPPNQPQQIPVRCHSCDLSFLLFFDVYLGVVFESMSISIIVPEVIRSVFSSQILVSKDICLFNNAIHKKDGDSHYYDIEQCCFGVFVY